MDTENTKVIFRKWNKSVDKKQGIIAIFPEELGTMSCYTCNSWEWVGEHGACDPQLVIKNSKPATESEYKEVKNFLENHYGYKLEVIQRLRYNAIEIRQQKIQELGNGHPKN
ncbi:MAG: hypothetical protein PX635_19235 [Nostocales cyanobacterium LE14-WE12]|jgi:hypothetical protein|nr:hypothetical protein [Nostocales cyanobacterium LE14-WE12]